MPNTDTKKTLGRNERKGITLLQLQDMFPDEASAHKWFENVIWPEGTTCPRCKGQNVYRSTHKQMPYRCRECNRFFSVKTGTALQSSKIPLRKWVYAIYLEKASLKGVSSMKLHRDLGVTQTTAWFMLRRIREAFSLDTPMEFEGAGRG